MMNDTKEEEGDRVDDHLKVTDVIGVRDGGDDLAKFCVMTPNHGFPFSRLRTATHGRLVALPHRDWQRLPRQLRRVHLGQSTSQDLPAPEASIPC